MTATGPHAGQPVETVGPAIEHSRAALVMLHGRNAGPANILDLVGPLSYPGFAYLAPAAADRTWYPFSFLSELDRNEPWLSSALSVIGELVERLEAQGIPRQRIVLLGFSQGACLAAEFLVRHPARYGGLLALSGGLIGPPGTSWGGNGSFAGTPVLLGCSDVDAHIPLERVETSAEVFARMGARVSKRIYPGMGHLINQDELAACRELLAEVAAAP